MSRKPFRDSTSAPLIINGNPFEDHYKIQFLLDTWDQHLTLRTCDKSPWSWQMNSDELDGPFHPCFSTGFHVLFSNGRIYLTLWFKDHYNTSPSFFLDDFLAFLRLNWCGFSPIIFRGNPGFYTSFSMFIKWDSSPSRHVAAGSAQRELLPRRQQRQRWGRLGCQSAARLPALRGDRDLELVESETVPWRWLDELMSWY